ncbi:hypothetical protein AAFF_G00130080 [Aldrovandia affinis]|uniref:Uncharacterized protein n=1 Tax=Aldrovandia affinis TaxID=143900 RepID=A0AAD7RRD2_9TELE|nr:hypothetical protein AAFF_G00130080 [Aldrovandia affinis]
MAACGACRMERVAPPQETHPGNGPGSAQPQKGQAVNRQVSGPLAAGRGQGGPQVFVPVQLHMWAWLQEGVSGNVSLKSCETLREKKNSQETKRRWILDRSPGRRSKRLVRPEISTSLPRIPQGNAWASLRAQKSTPISKTTGHFSSQSKRPRQKRTRALDSFL